MKAAGFAEWRVGLGRWEFGTRLLPAMTDGTSCAPRLAGLPAAAFAPPNSTDLDLIRTRDWFAHEGPRRRPELHPAGKGAER